MVAVGFTTSAPGGLLRFPARHGRVTLFLGDLIPEPSNSGAAWGLTFRVATFAKAQRLILRRCAARGAISDRVLSQEEIAPFPDIAIC